MNPEKSPPPLDANEEVSALIATLHKTGQRLEELTAGEVDTVADRDGRTFLLRGAQEQLRHIEAAKQAAILNVLAQSEAGLHRAQLMAKLAHVITGPDGSFERWSETLPQLVGVEPAHLPRTTRAWLELLHPDDRSLFRDKAIEAVAKKMRMELEYRLRRADGEWIQVRQTMEPLKAEGEATSDPRWFNTLQDVTVERRTEESLRESERRFSDLLQNVELVSVMLDREARITYCNEYLLRLTGWRHEEVIGRSWVELFIPPETGDLKDRLAALLADLPEARHGENKILTRSGERRLIRWNNSVLRSGAGDVIGTASIGEDITEQKRSETRIKRLNRVYAVLSGINTLIVRVRDRDELFREACRIAVQSGQFLLAWVAVADPRDQLVKAVAWAGDERGFVQLTRPTVDAKGQGKAGLGAQAMETRIPVICNDIGADGSAMRYAKEALERGYRSAAALPLVVDGTAVGTLVLYAAEAGFFDDEEMRLLQELAGDISFAIDHIEKEKKRKEAEKRILYLNRVYAILSGINTLIVRVRDRDELFREACRIAVEDGGFRMAWIGIVDRSVMKLVPVASAGVDEEMLTAIKDIYSSSESAPLANTMAARAMTGKKVVVSNDLQSNPQVVFGKKHAESGILSMAILPLIVSDEAAGVLALYASENEFFHKEELKLLTELAGDIAFAVENITAQQKLEKLSRIRAVSSEINAAIVRVREPTALLEETCRIASQDGKFEMVWIGTLHPDKQEVRAVAWTGFSAEAAHAVTWASISASKGTLAEAIRTRKPAIRNDIEAELPSGKLRQEAARRGCLSTICLPLEVEGKVVALIVLFATGRGFFDEGELVHLGELASNISFALESIARQGKIERLSRIRSVLGGINVAIGRIRDPQQLMQEACRIAVEQAGFPLAWIGMLDAASQDLKAVAMAGTVLEYAKLLMPSVRDDIPAGQGTNGRAFRERKPIVDNDMAVNPNVGFMREEGLRHGVRAALSLPLLVDGVSVGVMALYSKEKDYFDEEEVKLLSELAGDIAFAIDHIGKQERLDYLAYYDALTGLANRSLFLERVAQYMRSAVSGGHKLALFFLDLERFRNINDSLGRPAGDALLRQVAEWLTRNVGDANLVARVGADHFAVVLPEVKQEGNVVRLVEKTLEAFLEHPFRLNDAVFRIAFKVGGTLFPDDGANADTLFKNAEAALKKAKASGERYLFYTQKMTETVAGKLTLENQLRQALDQGEFELHYQPKVSLVSGKLTSAEALIRWNDPRTGLVPPGRFIPILEETGLIHGVGRWALRKAIEDHLRWRTAGLAAVRIAVNVSALQLRSRGFVAEIKQAIGMDAHAAAGLELEITESMIMEDVKNSIATLKAIRAMGVSIAIDDFGTGFSSLSYLSKLPVDTLKIDRSFVIDMTASPEGLALVSTIITLAHSLKLKVVAEGVETEEQSRLLRLLSCDEMQGFLFSKPVPSEIFETRFLAPPAARAGLDRAGTPIELTSPQ